MKKLFFLMVSLCCLAFYAGAQSRVGLDIDKTYPSPDVAALGAFGLIPANPFNGQASVSVPLYTVSYKELEVPITMSYATGGLKPDDHPGILGLGWTLQSGGMIYRKVNGLYDEHPREMPTVTYTNEICYYYNCGRVTSNFNNLDSIKKYALDNATADEVVKNAYDAHPDEFIFNFNGYSGIFYLTRATMNGPLEIKIKSNGAYKLTAEIVEMKDYIEFDDWVNKNSGVFTKRRTSRSIYKLKITDDKGIQYIFGGNPNAIEFSNNGDFSRDFYTIASTWHLTEIISPAGYKIQLTYKKKGRVLVQQKQRNALFYNVSYNFGANTLILFNATSGTYSYSGSMENIFILIQNPAYLDSIKTPLQNVTFTSSTTTELDYPFDVQKLRAITEPDYRFGADLSYWQKLDAIDIPGLKTIKFNYRNQTDKRLRLDSVEFTTAAREKMATYRFQYNPMLLPAYNAKMADHWGYYNGRSYAYGNDYLTTREPVAQYLQAEMLQQVNYPTGGYLKLDYEPHYYKKIVKQFPFTVEAQTANLMAGGLRVKKMTSAANANDVPLVKEYFYTEDYVNGGTNSSGILSGVPQYTNTGSAKDSYRTGSFWIGGWGSYTMNYGKIVDNNFLQLGSTNGNHVTYSQVTEKSGKGYTVYQYANHDNGYTDKAPYTIHTNFDSKWQEEGFVSLEAFRGLAMNTQYYDEAKRPLKSIRYEYFIDTGAAWKMLHFYRIHETIGNISLSRVSTCAYFTKPPLLRKTTETDYVAGTNDSLFVTTNYSYFPDIYPSGAAANDHYQQAEVTVKNSTEEVLKTTWNYPVDRVLKAQDATGVYQEMVNNNIVSPIIEEVSTRGATQLQLSRSNYYKPAPGIYVFKTIEAQPLAEPVETRLQVYQHDAKGNIVEQSKPGDAHEVILWGYQSQYPVARIKGSTYATASAYINQTMLDNAASYTDDQLRAELNKLRTNLPAAFVTTYTYALLRGKSSETNPQGKTTYYEYDGAGRLSVIRDQDKNIIKKICYNYAGQPSACEGVIYYNPAVSQSFTRNNCTDCLAGSAVTYAVPAAKHYSIISQADANAKAQADIAANGQNYANQQGTCSRASIYVTMTLENFTNDDEYSQSADMVLRFYNDINRTIPVAVSNLPVNYNLTTYYCGSNPTTTTNDQVVVCNGTSDTRHVQVYWDMRDDKHCWSKNYELLPSNCYYYKVYSNAPRSQVFNRNNCPAGYTGTPVTYPVPAGKYRSVISQADADAQAQAEINANGQNNANANGSCVFYNVPKSQSFTRNNCAAGQTGSTVTYTVPADKYSSAVSQADADAQAQNDINTNGQNYANTNGTCTNPGYPYVSMSLTNITTDGDRQSADLLFRFYQDAARTIPLSVTNLTVNYKVDHTPCSGAASSINNTLVCNGTSTSTRVQISFDQGDGKHCWTKRYTLLAGTGYYK